MGGWKRLAWDWRPEERGEASRKTLVGGTRFEPCRSPLGIGLRQLSPWAGFAPKPMRFHLQRVLSLGHGTGWGVLECRAILPVQALRRVVAAPHISCNFIRKHIDLVSATKSLSSINQLANKLV